MLGSLRDPKSLRTHSIDKRCAATAPPPGASTSASASGAPVATPVAAPVAAPPDAAAPPLVRSRFAAVRGGSPAHATMFDSRRSSRRWETARACASEARCTSRERKWSDAGSGRAGGAASEAASSSSNRLAASTSLLEKVAT